MPSFAEFLARNAVKSAGILPLVQTRAGYQLKRIIEQKEIAVEECDVFVGESLNYFFVGRPAYKFKKDDAEAEYWELPVCFIFEYEAIDGIKRIFPFDTGAHHLGLYPNYMQVMKKEEFEVSSVPDSAGKIIGAFFGNSRSYFDLKAKEVSTFEAEHALGPLDAEVRAIHRLARIPAPGKFDDRRLAIEVQSDQNVDLGRKRPLAVILPQIYMDSPEVRNVILNDWGAKVITYPMMPLNVASYYSAVYERVLDFYERIGAFS